MLQSQYVLMLSWGGKSPLPIYRRPIVSLCHDIRYSGRFAVMIQPSDNIACS